MKPSGGQYPVRAAVSWQAKFASDTKWGDCSKEHFDWVKRSPSEFVGYEVRELFDAPASPDHADSKACPITGLAFYGNLLHPDHGLLAMYGGPFDVYSIPRLQDGGGELRRERYDLDADCWIEGGAPLGYFCREQQPNAAIVDSATGISHADVSLAAQMLTWGRGEGLTDTQMNEIDIHAQKLFELLDARAVAVACTVHEAKEH